VGWNHCHSSESPDCDRLVVGLLPEPIVQFADPIYTHPLL
jgi:hypothetical protein